MTKVLWNVSHPLMLHELPSIVIPHGLLRILLLLRACERPYKASLHLLPLHARIQCIEL